MRRVAPCRAMIQFSRRDRACRIVRAALPGVEEDETNHARMPAREALEQANAAPPGAYLFLTLRHLRDPLLIQEALIVCIFLSGAGSSMSWKCPACQTQIRHELDEPTAKQVYRCHVFRLELVLDEWSNEMTVAPLPAETTPTKPNRRTKDFSIR